MEINESRVYRQTMSTTTLTRTTQQSPSLEKVCLNGNGEQITLSHTHTHPARSLPLPRRRGGVALPVVINQLMISNVAVLARNFVVANGLRLPEQQLRRLGVIKIYAWTAA